MNILEGKIQEVTVSQNLTRVIIKVGSQTLSTVVIDTPETAPYLVEGHPVRVVFKESEVIIGKGDLLEISLQNKIRGKITDLQSGELLGKVVLETDIGKITSIITANAVKTLGLMKGMLVWGMIKSNEIILSHD